MGAVTFSIDPRLIETLKQNLILDTFIETGTFNGDTIETVKEYFNNIYSIELSEEYYNKANKRFNNNPKIKLIHDDASNALSSIMPQVQQKPCIFWLDAHWCVAENTAGQSSQCGLLSELNAINELNYESIIIIDDARLFLAAPGKPHDIADWPTFNDICKTLFKLSDKHNLAVINDCILFFPSTIEDAIKKFAHNHGIDWLQTIDKSHDYDKLLIQLKTKDHLILSLDEACKEKETLLQQNEGDLQSLKLLLKRKKSFIMTICKSLIKPKIGLLDQHSPKKLTLPNRYQKKIHLSQMPRISIVTPSFNQAEFIERTILSVTNQHYPNLEYIIQDGGSTDESIDIIRKSKKFLMRWESKKDNGQSQAINLGFQHSTGDIMAYLNSDDLLIPGSLHYVAHYFNQHPDVDVVYGHRVVIDKYDQEVGRWILPEHDKNVLTYADFVPQETLFWRRRIWNKIGAHIDESFNFAMDWDLLLRFQEAGATFKRLPRFLGCFRVHPSQKTSSSIEFLGEDEMKRLRMRCHGRNLSQSEIKHNLKFYKIKHVIINHLYRAGILRY